MTDVAFVTEWKGGEKFRVWVKSFLRWKVPSLRLLFHLMTNIRLWTGVTNW